MSAATLRAILLGGVGEVGKNSTLFDWQDELLLVDAGVKFPEDELHGVDLVIPELDLHRSTRPSTARAAPDPRT